MSTDIGSEVRTAGVAEVRTAEQGGEESLAEMGHADSKRWAAHAVAMSADCGAAMARVRGASGGGSWPPQKPCADDLRGGVPLTDEQRQRIESMGTVRLSSPHARKKSVTAGSCPSESQTCTVFLLHWSLRCIAHQDICLGGTVAKPIRAPLTLTCVHCAGHATRAAHHPVDWTRG